MSSRIGANVSYVYAKICSCTSVTWTSSRRPMKLRRVLVRMHGDVYKRSGLYGYMHKYILNWLQQTLLRSVRRDAKTEFSITQVRTQEGDNRSLRVPRVSQYEGTRRDKLLIQYGVLLSIMEAGFFN